jgi:hypothetical protein
MTVKIMKGFIIFDLYKINLCTSHVIMIPFTKNTYNNMRTIKVF